MNAQVGGSAPDAGRRAGAADVTGVAGPGEWSGEVTTPDGMRRVGSWLAGMLRAGDLVILTGPLGAGKTVLTQGLGRGLGVRGEVTSPTFVIARVHPSLGAGPALVHVDGWRVGSVLEIDALDLDASLDDSVTVVEWGEGLVEQLAGERLEVTIERPRGAAGVTGGVADAGTSAGADVDSDGGADPEAGPRQVRIRAIGAGMAARLDAATAGLVAADGAR